MRFSTMGMTFTENEAVKLEYGNDYLLRLGLDHLNLLNPILILVLVVGPVMHLYEPFFCLLPRATYLNSCGRTFTHYYDSSMPAKFYKDKNMLVRATKC